MGSKFRQISAEDRIAITHLLRAGISKANIAKQLGFHRSTIYREVNRNSSAKLGYIPIIAKQRIKARRKRATKLEYDKDLREYIFQKLKQSWSPEQIAGRLKLKNNNQSVICHETIYAYLYSDAGIRNKYYQYLREKRRFRYPKVSRHSRIKIPNRVPISERPVEANKRSEIGHWECDLMMFRKGIKTNIITLRERRSRFLIAIKNPNRRPSITVSNIIQYLERVKKHRLKSVTFDNGVEFCHHKRIIDRFKIPTYFCEPYKSYQKGTVENGNKLLRQWLPRTAEIGKVSALRVKCYAMLINRRPMKCLGFKTPEEVYYSNAS